MLKCHLCYVFISCDQEIFVDINDPRLLTSKHNDVALVKNALSQYSASLSLMCQCSCVASELLCHCLTQDFFPIIKFVIPILSAQ